MMGKRFEAQLHLKSPFDPKNLRVLGDYSSAAEDATASVKTFLTDYHDALAGKKSAVAFQ